MGRPRTAVKICREFVHTMAFKQDFKAAKHILADNCIIHRNLGTGYGREDIVGKIKATSFAIAPIKILEFDELIAKNCAMFRLRWKGKHVDTFQSIKATGKIVDFDISLMIDLSGNKIERARISCDIDAIIKQIGKKSRVKDTIVSLSYGQSSLIKLYGVTSKYLQTQNIDLTLKQFAHLCLWVMGKSDTEAMRIFGVKQRTVKYFQAALKKRFNCAKKAQLMECTRSLGLTHLLLEGFKIIIEASEHNLENLQNDLNFYDLPRL